MSDYGTPRQQLVRHARVDNLNAMRFPAGSMGPKVAAGCGFVSETGGTAAIGSLADAGDVIDGNAGTQIVPR